MLELRVTVDAKRLASMREAVTRECLRLSAGTDHAETVAFVIEHLVGKGAEPEATARRRRAAARRAEVLVIVTVQSDATMLMVREITRESSGLGEARQRLLQLYAARWSTMAGSDGRTILAEIARTAPDRPDCDRKLPRAPVAA